jgi:hypothetical protein
MAPDTQTAVKWLKAWHGPSGPWLVVEIDPSVENPLVPARRFTEEQPLQEYLDDRNGIVNLYFVPNIIEGAPRTTPTKDQIKAIWAIYVDLDLPKSGPFSLPTEENFTRLLSRLKLLEPPPTAIIFSGGGYQAFWRFAGPLIAHEDNNLERIEASGKAIARDLGSDAVQNINRLMRLPGTINLPSSAKLARGRVPALAAIVETNWDRTWSYESDPVPHLPEGAHTADDEKVHPSVGSLPVKLQKAIKTGDASDYNDDRSRLVFAVVTALIRRGWPDGDIIPILIDPSCGIAAHCLSQPNPTAVARRQVERARHVVAIDWERTSHGSIDPLSPKNVRKALNDMGIKLSHNVFQDRSYVNGVGPARCLDDPTEAEIRVNTYERFGFLPTRDILNITTSTIARQAAYHPVLDYFNALPLHDPSTTQNLTEEWLIRFAGAKDTPFIRATSRLILLAAVRRVRNPGCKFDEMMVLISPIQGTEKSLALSTLAVNEDWFTDSFPLKADEKKTIEQLSGRWIVECAELQGIHQSDVETIKSILSRQVDRARLAYGHHPTNAPRQCVFFGTTNSTAFLRDRTNRRFWPIYVLRFDIAALRAAREALWAEAAYLESLGTSIRLDPTLWDEAAVVQDAVRQGDPWTDILLPKLFDTPCGCITSNDVWKIINKPEHQRGSPDNGRLTEAMLELGWERVVQRIATGKGPPSRCFVKGDTWEDRHKDIYVYRDPIDGTVEVSYNDAPTANHLQNDHDETPF